MAEADVLCIDMSQLKDLPADKLAAALQPASSAHAVEVHAMVQAARSAIAIAWRAI